MLDELNRREVIYGVNGDSKRRACGVINISIEDIDGEGMLHMLDTHDICVSTGSACNSESKEPSYVLSAMKLEEDRIDSAIRVSIGRYNTEEDIMELVKWITHYYKILKNLV